ncbi:GTP 3',8-cyclase MoaA [Marinitoga litoralis]|uniref:GTP 3',8-cyclase MoaA n=1 Tax=Marinitoga litoralis TaxID=570855 RepID=UPI00195FEC2A|nr:GTP 3',8-cyclase MoaA [Marinitoga litoralis]MBM7558367.1 cyclic pyranopterin phosphate synthase [Marinitoga litoralis]
MIDKYNRKINYVRLSITDKCNFRCNYCMGEDAKFMQNNELLSLNEIRILIKNLKELDFKHIRLTGGEPTLRNDIIDIAKIIHYYFGEFSITTNGSFMELLAKDLKENGLKNVNFSLDSLKRETFIDITKRDDLNNVLKGLEKSIKIGLKVKLNTVIQKRNFNEVFELIEFAAKYKLPIRFIELMPIGKNYNEDDFISEDILKSKISEKYTLIPYKENFGIGPSKYYFVKELNSYIGFISAITHNFCSLCNKIRIAANGDIYPCLAYDYHISLKEYFNNEIELKEKIKMAVFEKPQKHYFKEIKKTTPMHKMGG